jgi:hypothetical protein
MYVVLVETVLQIGACNSTVGCRCCDKYAVLCTTSSRRFNESHQTIICVLMTNVIIIPHLCTSSIRLRSTSSRQHALHKHSSSASLSAWKRLLSRNRYALLRYSITTAISSTLPLLVNYCCTSVKAVMITIYCYQCRGTGVSDNATVLRCITRAMTCIDAKLYSFEFPVLSGSVQYAHMRVTNIARSTHLHC